MIDKQTPFTTMVSMVQLPVSFLSVGESRVMGAAKRFKFSKAQYLYRWKQALAGLGHMINKYKKGFL